MASCAVLAFPGLAMAGPMPVLPELPPLPTHYQGSHDFYAGILTGYIGGSTAGLGAGLVVGNTFQASDLLLGIEAMGFADTRGEISIEASARVGVPLTDTIDVFGNAGLGYSFDTAAYVSIGASLEAEMGDGWIVRVDYRYNHYLSGDPETHKVLMGLLRGF
ncbi:MAG: outer membrane protein [Devosia sp.]